MITQENTASSTAPAIIETTGRLARQSITETMASQYGMMPAAFEATVRAMCSPGPTQKNPNPNPLTREEFATFLLVARKYDLNPLMREIYALPKKGGGVIPSVSVDGWLHLANSHPAFDGMEFNSAFDESGKLVSTTCIIYRKDRTHHTSVTELLSECLKDTDQWRGMPNRMLRHKAAIQAVRYTFGFAGICDEDEAEKISVATSPKQMTVEASKGLIAELDAIAAGESGEPFGDEPPHDRLPGEVVETSVPGSQAPATPAYVTMTEASAIAGNGSDAPRDPALQALMDLAHEKAKGGVAILETWRKRLNASDYALIKPHLDSYREQAVFADRARSTQ
ncbi:MAG: recombinase RecT [Methylocella sp.]